MLLYKLSGSLLLGVSAFCMAVMCNRGFELEIRSLEGYIELIRYIRREIDFYALPIDEILKKCDTALIEQCGGVHFDEDRPRDFSMLFSLSQSRIKDKVARKEIEEFCLDFGKNYREEQLKRCDATISVLEARRDFLRGEVENKKKMSYTLSLSAAAALIILLI